MSKLLDADQSNQGYDHSYFFMASFAKDHVDHAAKHLGLGSA